MSENSRIHYSKEHLVNIGMNYILMLEYYPVLMVL